MTDQEDYAVDKIGVTFQLTHTLSSNMTSEFLSDDIIFTERYTESKHHFAPKDVIGSFRFQKNIQCHHCNMTQELNFVQDTYYFINPMDYNGFKRFTVLLNLCFFEYLVFSPLVILLTGVFMFNVFWVLQPFNFAFYSIFILMFILMFILFLSLGLFIIFPIFALTHLKNTFIIPHNLWRKIKSLKLGNVKKVNLIGKIYIIKSSEHYIYPNSTPSLFNCTFQKNDA